MKILIIDDDTDLVEFLHQAFIHEGWVCDTAFDGQKGSFMARSNEYDCIILDCTMPKKNGETVCAEIREIGKHTPILVMSATQTTPTKIQLLNLGADDYIVKPIDYSEIIARIRALVRRPHIIQNNIIKIEDLVIDTNKQTLIIDGVGIYLTKKEYLLLEYLAKNKGMIVSRGMIMEHVWNSESDPFSNTIEAHIRNLRKKINSQNSDSIIKNIPGRGYSIGYEL